MTTYSSSHGKADCRREVEVSGGGCPPKLRLDGDFAVLHETPLTASAPEAPSDHAAHSDLAHSRP